MNVASFKYVLPFWDWGFWLLLKKYYFKHFWVVVITFYNPINILRTLAINSNQIVLSFGVLIVFSSPKQSEIEESSLESISKSRI